VRPALAKAIRYGLYHWDGLIRSLHDDHLELDTSIAEHAIYPVALDAKKRCSPVPLSGGQHWAIVATLIQSAESRQIFEPAAGISPKMIS
jgi:hypothetical protein